MKSVWLILIACSVLSVSGCATSRKSPTALLQSPNSTDHLNSPVQKAQPPSRAETMGPPEPSGSIGGPVPPQSSYGPDPIRTRPVVLILGPGLAKGYAYVGVIQAFHDFGIPIGAILGTEMGGFIGALYSNSGSLNQLEWSLMKFKEDCFLERTGFLSSIQSSIHNSISGSRAVPSNGNKFVSQLTRIFGKKDLRNLKVPIQIAFQNVDNGQVLVVDQGNTVNAIRATMAKPSLFTPAHWLLDEHSNVPVISADQVRPFLVNEGHAMGIGPVIVIDVLSDTEVSGVWDELKAADLMIKPDLSGIDELDFQKSTDAAFRGKSAVLRQLSEIRALVGLPDSDFNRKRGVGP